MVDFLDIQKLKARVSKWIEVKMGEGLSQAQMGKMVGTGRAYFNNLSKGTSGVGLTALDHILKIDPKLNKYWLFFGEGEMYDRGSGAELKGGSLKQVADKDVTNTELYMLIKELQDQVKKKDDQIKFLQNLIEEKL